MGSIWQGLLDGFTWLIEILYRFSGNYGMAIVLLTLLVRGVLWPLTWPQAVSARKMQDIQPQLQELQKKYKNNPDKLNQETMKLWQENGVNPAAGCLPLLLQLPILYGLYGALRVYPQFVGAGFLWLADLSRPDSIFILPVLAAVTTLAQTWISMRTSAVSGAAGQQQRMMMIIMPLFIGWITFSLPAGLGVYFVVTNLFSVFQTAMVPVIMARSARPGAQQGGK